MAKSVNSIIEEAKAYATTAKNDEENLYVMLGTVPADTPKMLTLTRGVFSVRATSIDTLKGRGKKIFRKFEKYLKKAVCEDFNYCERKDEVKKDLDKYLPEIVKVIIKRIPLSGKLPGWLGTILKFFGIAAASTEVLVTMFVAWIIIKGCDELCACKD